MSVEEEDPNQMQESLGDLLAEAPDEDSLHHEDTNSAVSSVGDVGDDPFDVNALVDLTSEIFCRVRMTRSVEGTRITCACGGPALACPHRNHNDKRQADAQELWPVQGSILECLTRNTHGPMDD